MCYQIIKPSSESAFVYLERGTDAWAFFHWHWTWIFPWNDYCEVIAWTQINEFIITFFFFWDCDLEIENIFKIHGFLGERVLRNQESEKCREPVLNWFHFPQQASFTLLEGGHWGGDRQFYTMREPSTEKDVQSYQLIGWLHENCWEQSFFWQLKFDQVHSIVEDNWNCKCH